MNIQSMATDIQQSPEGEFSHSPWVDVPPFPSPLQTPPTGGFGFFSPAMNTYHMPSYTDMQPPMMHTWPSMIAQDGAFQSPVMHAPASFSPPTSILPTRKTSTGGSTPRRTLTDEDRRQMCLYHEENKTAKQTDIGALFGVERSTVSKVLRQKEKYLNPDDGCRSPIKRAKGRVPDIEKALSNWAKNYQSLGKPLTDQLIKEKALFFAHTSGCPEEGKAKVCTPAWLEKFKQKNNLGSKLRRPGSRGDITASTRIDTNFGSIPRSDGLSLSPASSFEGLGPAMSPHSQDGGKQEMPEELVGLGTDQFGYFNNNTTSLNGSPVAVVSPTSTLVESERPYTPIDPSLILNNQAMNQQNNKGEQTYTAQLASPLDLQYRPKFSKAVSPTFSSPQTKSFQPRSPTASTQTRTFPPRSPMTGSAHSRPLQPRSLRHSTSTPNLVSSGSSAPTQDVSNSSSIPQNPASSTPPTLAEACSALDLLVNYFDHQPAGLGSHGHYLLGRLKEKLGPIEEQSEMTSSSLSRIPEGQLMGSDEPPHPRLSKKRSIHDMRL